MAKENDDLIHDIERYVAIASEQAARICLLEDGLTRILNFSDSEMRDGDAARDLAQELLDGKLMYTETPSR